MGIKGVYLNDKEIIVAKQFGKYGYTETKNKKSRTIPLSSMIIGELQVLKNQNGDGYLFSEDGGVTPICRKNVTNAFSAALSKLGINRAEQKKRGLSFHSWRHHMNTSLVLADISDVKVREVTGHLSGKMTKKYTHIKTADMNEIIKVQETMFGA